MNPIHIRHALHANPELSGEEAETSAFIVEQLRHLGIQKIHRGFAQQLSIDSLSPIFRQITGVVRGVGIVVCFLRCLKKLICPLFSVNFAPIKTTRDFSYSSIFWLRKPNKSPILQ